VKAAITPGASSKGSHGAAANSVRRRVSDAGSLPDGSSLEEIGDVKVVVFLKDH
jgi:hypothetical protein